MLANLSDATKCRMAINDRLTDGPNRGRDLTWHTARPNCRRRGRHHLLPLLS